MKYICSTVIEGTKRKCHSKCDFYIAPTNKSFPNCKYKFGKLNDPSEQCPAFNHNFAQVEISCNVIKTFDEIGPEEEKLMWRQCHEKD